VDAMSIVRATWPNPSRLNKRREQFCYDSQPLENEPKLSPPFLCKVLVCFFKATSFAQIVFYDRKVVDAYSDFPTAFEKKAVNSVRILKMIIGRD